jgi:protein SCO1/2
VRPRLLPAALALGLLAQGAAAQQGASAVLREIGFDQRLGEPLPLDIPFRDEAGREVTLQRYFTGKPVVLSLNYYECPMLCTVALNGLASALATLSFDAGKEFEIVTVSFDPKEGPALARAKKDAYLQRYKRATAAEGWHFLTGSQQAIDRLTQAVGFRYAWDEQTKQWAHPAGVLVLTAQGKIARYLYGIEYAPKDLRFALVEASAGKIGTPMDAAILYCYRYDPMTGRYSAAVMRLLRTGALVTLAGLLAFVAASLRRERPGERR